MTDYPFEQIQPSYLRAQGNIDIPEFNFILNRLLRNIELPTDYWPENTTVVLSPESPDLSAPNVNVPYIVWDIIRRFPFPNEPNPKRRHVEPYEHVGSNVLIIYGQSFVNTVEYRFIDRSNLLAIQLQQWFEDVFQTYYGLLESYGIGPIRYEERTSDRLARFTEIPGGTKYAIRTTRYQISNEVLTLTTEKLLEEVKMTISAYSSIAAYELVVRTSGSYDELAHSDAYVILSVTNEPYMYTTYVEGTNFYLEGGRIHWIATSSNKPSVGSAYYVSYVFGEPTTFSLTAERLKLG